MNMYFFVFERPSLTERCHCSHGLHFKFQCWRYFCQR